MIKKTVSVLLLLAAAAGLSGQSITSTQFPSGIKWKQIETERCILIFPEELELKAKEIAADIDSLFPADEASLKTEVGKWPVILNNTLTKSNGYVMGAPRYSQLYCLPAQDSWCGTGDWLTFLWSHELRHIVQNEKMQRGFTAFAGILAGEYGLSGMSHFALPRLFWEGDAVLTETLLSSSGRGRLADFERGLRTNLLNDIRFDYNKSALGSYGSYKDNVQSWYVSGYHFCTYLRREYGIEAFNRIIEISADYSFAPLIVNIAVKNVTGKDIKALYEDCLDELAVLWQQQLDNTNLTEIREIAAGDIDAVTSFYPLGIVGSSGNIAALKTSRSHRHRLVEILPDGELNLLKTINPEDSNISFNGTTFCWSEQKADVRWGNSSWSVIRVYSPDTGEYRLLTERSRYFAPAINFEGDRIAAAEYTKELDSALVILDSKTGDPIKRFPQPSGAVALQPCWSSDGQSLIFIRQQDNRKALYTLDLQSRKETLLLEPTTADIASPAESGGFVFYESDATGLQQIHAVPLSGGAEYIAVSRPFGASEPTPADGSLLLADYTEWGWALSESVINPEEWLPAEDTENSHVDYFAEIADEEPFFGFLDRAETDDSEKTAAGNYVIEDYQVIAGLFNYHSRGLSVPDSGSGIELYFQSDDVLNYSSTRIYTGWDTSNNELLIGFAGAWAGFFPILLYGAEITTPTASIAESFDTSFYGGAALPFDFSDGNTYNYLSLQSVFYLDLDLSSGTAGTAVLSKASWELTEREAWKDLMPGSGVETNAAWYYSLSSGAYNYLSAETIFYFPGILENHGLSLDLEGEYNFDSALLNMSPVKLPRGLSGTGLSYQLIFNGSIDYSLPIAYPDFNMGSFLHIPRIYMNIFLDAAAGFDDAGQSLTWEDTELMSTAGLEFYADFHLFNNIVPLEAGLRLIYDLQSGGFRLEDTVLELGFSLP